MECGKNVHHASCPIWLMYTAYGNYHILNEPIFCCCYQNHTIQHCEQERNWNRDSKQNVAFFSFFSSSLICEWFKIWRLCFSPSIWLLLLYNHTFQNIISIIIMNVWYTWWVWVHWFWAFRMCVNVYTWNLELPAFDLFNKGRQRRETKRKYVDGLYCRLDWRLALIQYFVRILFTFDTKRRRSHNQSSVLIELCYFLCVSSLVTFICCNVCVCMFSTLLTYSSYCLTIQYKTKT